VPAEAPIAEATRPDRPGLDGICYHARCLGTEGEQCAAHLCPRFACWTHGESYQCGYTDSQQGYVCLECLPRVQAGELLLGTMARAALQQRRDDAASAAAARPPERLQPTWDGPGGHPLGHVAFHTTHNMLYRQGVAWCTRCGSWTSGDRPLAVLNRCLTAPASGAGIDLLARIAKGHTPKPRMVWPLPEGVGPPSGPLHAQLRQEGLPHRLPPPGPAPRRPAQRTPRAYRKPAR